MGTTAPGNYTIPPLTSDWTASDEFTDPTTAGFEDLITARIAELLGGVEDPARQQYAGLLQQFVEMMSTNDPALNDLIGSLQQLAGSTATPGLGESLATKLAPEYMTLDPAYKASADAYLAKLAGDPYTGAEWEAYRTQALDPIEADRTAAKQRALARLSQQGVDPSSGIGQALLAEVDRGFDAMRAGAQGDLAIKRVEDRRERDQEIYEVYTALNALLTNRQLTGVDLGMSATDAQRGRLALGASTYGTLADILPARAAQQLGAAGQLSDLSGSVRGEEETRRSQAIALQGILAELPERRLQLALSTLGQGESPGSMVSSLLGVGGLANATGTQKAMTTANTWSGLSSLLGYLSPLWNKSGAMTTAPAANTWEG